MLVQPKPEVAALTRKTSLTAGEQTTIESEITRLSAERNCSRQLAAQLINRIAYPEAR